MTKLQIYTQSKEGPSINFQMYCTNCNSYKETEIEKEIFQSKCLKSNKIIDQFDYVNDKGLPEIDITPNWCPCLDTEKANLILDAIENYVKI